VPHPFAFVLRKGGKRGCHRHNVCAGDLPFSRSKCAKHGPPSLVEQEEKAGHPRVEVATLMQGKVVPDHLAVFHQIELVPI